jgi:asparagine synthase (glutamine-hydrolysing)
MCGIAGYCGQGDKDILLKMTNTLYHRGPDGSGVFVSGQTGLGHRRLSIIDLSDAGGQPMTNEDGSVAVAFNGEIYNFLELRKKLEKNHKFKSKTDTEVIAHLYEEIGEKVFSELNGMFAIAIWDENKKELILGRDRLGKKPLYWAQIQDTLIFGSEIKALLRHPLFKKELDLKSLSKYFAYEYIPTPHAIFKNTYKLEPGFYLKYGHGKIEKMQYWDIGLKRLNLKHQMPDVLTELDEKINQAVKSRLISDAPLGVFLSGGLDSSAIAYYAQKNTAEKIKTFSIAFNEDSFDESKYARKVARFLKSDHYEERLNSKKVLELIPQIADLLDEPMADSSIIPTYLLSKFTKKYVKVALGGDGGDELFCGYDTFVAHKVADVYEKIPLLLRKKIIEKIIKILPVSFKNISFDFKAKRFIDGFYGEKKYRDQRWMGAFNNEQMKLLFSKGFQEQAEINNIFDDIDNYNSRHHIDDFFNQLIYLYLKMYMMDDILVKVDRASMFASLETRSPFLDYKLVEYIYSLPNNLKLKGLKTKYILKKLMEGKLPNDIIYRKKKGFGTPIAMWLSAELKPLVLDLLSRQRIERQGIFNYEYINNILNSHFSKKADNRKQIWALLVFQLWWDKWYK